MFYMFKKEIHLHKHKNNTSKNQFHAFKCFQALEMQLRDVIFKGRGFV